MGSIFENKIKINIHNGIKTVNAGRFQILLPEIFGFCGGVIAALKKLENAIKNNLVNNKIFLLGEIIHNPSVNQSFIDAGVIIIHENEMRTVFNLANDDDFIVIPAFGIPLDLEIKIRQRYKNIVDTTCRNVKSVWNFILQESELGSTIILHGKPDHPEVKASISRAGDNNCVIVLPNLNAAEKFLSFLKYCFSEFTVYDHMEIKENKLQLWNLKKDKFLKFIYENNLEEYILFHNIQNFNFYRLALTNQTTMLYDDTIALEKSLRNGLEGSKCELYACDTICKATFLRQLAAKKICNLNPDLIIVIGGYDSSNTTHLYYLAKQFSKVYFIKDSFSITESILTYFIPEKNQEQNIDINILFHNILKITILAGASCPFREIYGVINKLSNI